jgi:predicted O-linked N-acetylglucosamine transferase (SPINDLY family)
VTNFPAGSQNFPSPEGVNLAVRKLQALIAQAEYAQVIDQCQQLITTNPQAKIYYWYLGLALLLLGQEAEAQMVWLEAIDTDEPAQLDQWTWELWQVLQTEADRRETRLQRWFNQQNNQSALSQTSLEASAQRDKALDLDQANLANRSTTLTTSPEHSNQFDQFAVAPEAFDIDTSDVAIAPESIPQEQQIIWAIRQHMRELMPIEVNNLLKIVQRSIELGIFTGDEPIELGLIELLANPTEIIKPVDPQLLAQTLFHLLEIAPVHPNTLAFAAACLRFSADQEPQVIDELDIANLLLKKAVSLAHVDRQPQQAILLANLCLASPQHKAEALRELTSLFLLVSDYNRSIESAEAYYELQTSLAGKVIANQLAIQARLKAGGYWQEVLTLAERQIQLLDQLAATDPAELDRVTVIRLFSSTFFLPYLHDQPEPTRDIRNRIAALCQAQVRNYTGDLAAKFAQGHAARASQVIKGDRSPQRRLRIGYLSHYFYSHSVGWLCRWLFAEHDRDQFEIFTYFILYKPNFDVVQDFIANHSEHVRKLDADSQAIAAQIYADEIDILVDLDSITLDVSCEIMSLKPAPIQVTWLGMDASGIPAIDYFLADPYVLPADADRYYHEKIWRLPHTFIAINGFGMSFPTITRRDLGIPEPATVYLSSQTGYKRHPDHARSQMQIIKAVPGSYFLIKGFADQNALQDFFLNLADQEGVAHDRLMFLANTPTELIHRANLAIADVVLDTFPYNGATTTMETLWSGVPIVTRVGEQFAARNSYSMLMNAQVEAGIAWSDREYIDWGIRLGSDRQLHQRTYSQLQQAKHTAPLWNTRQFARDLEQAYLGMWAEFGDRA